MVQILLILQCKVLVFFLKKTISILSLTEPHIHRGDFILSGSEGRMVSDVQLSPADDGTTPDGSIDGFPTRVLSRGVVHVFMVLWDQPKTRMNSLSSFFQTQLVPSELLVQLILIIKNLSVTQTPQPVWAGPPGNHPEVFGFPFWSSAWSRLMVLKHLLCLNLNLQLPMRDEDTWLVCLDLNLNRVQHVSQENRLQLQIKQPLVFLMSEVQTLLCRLLHQCNRWPVSVF